MVVIFQTTVFCCDSNCVVVARGCGVAVVVVVVVGGGVGDVARCSSL